MSLVQKANQIINTRSEEKERQYGPMTEGMKAATVISEFLNARINESDELGSFKYLYGLKMSRQKYNHKEDNLLDAIAYRIAEINAILEDEGKSPLTSEQFDEVYQNTTKGITKYPAADTKIINALTTLNLSGDDIYKIYLGLEMVEEKNAIIDENNTKRIISIIKQIHILNLMNEANHVL